jgi:hypothetical protein
LDRSPDLKVNKGKEDRPLCRWDADIGLLLSSGLPAALGDPRFSDLLPLLLAPPCEVLRELPAAALGCREVPLGLKPLGELDIFSG